MVPPSKYITHNMLNRAFYDNHLFYHCEYDEKMMINLAGKVIQSNNNQFNTYLLFKRPMLFNVIDEGMREVGNSCIKVIYIDNVIDETAFSQSSIMMNTGSKRDSLKRMISKDEYINNFFNLMKKNEDLKEMEILLSELVEKLQNNYILIKNHVLTYSKYFQELGIEYRSALAGKLQKYRNDDNFNLIINEMTESLIFSKVHQFLYNNIQQFNVEEEAELKTKINNIKSDFSFTHYKLESIFNECKFKTAISEIKKISNLIIPFEKLVTNISNIEYTQPSKCLHRERMQRMRREKSFKEKEFPTICRPTHPNVDICHL